MVHPIDRVLEFQRRLATISESDPDQRGDARLYLFRKDGLLHLEFNGVAFDDVYTELLSLLGEAGVSDLLGSLSLRGPDEGANGTRNWSLTPLVENTGTFPHLRSFFVEPTDVADHNRSIIGDMYDEAGVIGRLLAKAPRLQSLTVPSAPNELFFEGRFHPLEQLYVDVGYDHQNFIVNLSQSPRFPHLRVLNYGDYNERYDENYTDNRTPFEQYQALFQSHHFSAVKSFILRNSGLTIEQLSALKSLRPDMLFRVGECYGSYFR